MRELDAGHAAFGMDETSDPRQHLDVGVLPDPEIVRADPAVGLHGGGLGKRQAGAADGEATEVDQVPVVGESIGARVLTHRRHEDAVRQCGTANGQRREELRHRKDHTCAARSIGARAGTCGRSSERMTS
jgi:hypothetical protein